jgi:enoyl-CoA hydratase
MHNQATAEAAVHIEVEEGIGTLTIDRPQVLNALSRSVLLELDQAITRLSTDAAVHGVIVTGAGAKAFVAGADIQELDRLDGASGYTAARFGQGIFRRLEVMPKPSVAAVNGYALGGGLELALACTFRIAAETAKLGLPEVGLGIIPGYGGTQRLARLMGTGRALELILTGEPVGAAEAHRIGLVNRVVSPADLLPAARQMLKTILGRGPLAVVAALEVVMRGAESALDSGLELEAQAFGRLCSTADMHEGMAAFLAKRKATFSGR